MTPPPTDNVDRTWFSPLLGVDRVPGVAGAKCGPLKSNPAPGPGSFIVPIPPSRLIASNPPYVFLISVFPPRGYF